MNVIILYLLKVAAIQGFFFLFYRLVLSRSARHSINRVYLLGTVVLAFIIPFIELPASTSPAILTADSEIVQWFSEPDGILEFELIPVKNEQSSFSYLQLIPWFYGMIACMLIIRSLVYLFTLHRLKRHSYYIKKRWFKLFKTSHDRPFSFFSNVFMPKSLFGSEAFKQILAHECVHVRQFHSVDRLLLDFVVSLFWFNPFIYLYRNALIEIHEYQADEAVVRRFQDPIGYQEILFSQLQSAQYSGLVSHFNFSMIKKRIVMMNKQNKMSGWVYALTAPVLLSMVFAFSSKDAMQPINQVGDEIATLLGPESPMAWSEFQAELATKLKLDEVQQDYTPSILPLKNTENVRMTSGFGKRVDPIDKVSKNHTGIDFATPVNNPVIAPADGEILFAEEDGRHGLRIKMKHGDSFQTAYSHLGKITVKVGDKVKKGDQIALSGNTGQSTAPHLHYEVIKEGEGSVNPIYYIKNYNFKVKTSGSSEVDKADEVRFAELRKKEEELARKEMMIAKTEEERVKAELTVVEAKEAQERAEMEMRRAEEYRAVAEEKAKLEVLRAKEQEAQRNMEIHESKKIKEKKKVKSKDN